MSSCRNTKNAVKALCFLPHLPNDYYTLQLFSVSLSHHNSKIENMYNHSLRSKCSTKISHLPFSQLENSYSESICLSSFYTDARLEISDTLIEDGSILLFVRCCNTDGICPYCGASSSKVHSKYYRTIVDLPVLGKAVTIRMESRKFFCPNEKCKKKTFAEQPGNEVFRYRRRTRRCEILVAKHGLYCSSNKAKALINATGIPLCNTTVLRDIHRMNVDEYNCVENIGIDDWAFRKGVTYGSIIINLDTGQAIDLLGNRNQDSFEAWLENHQKVSLVSRDRSTEYSAAISSSGMNITEVADRFHLIKNMSDCITKVISENYADYRGLIRAGENQPAKEVPVRKEAPVRVDSRQVMFDEVKELQGKGFKIAKIAKQLGIARQTVRKYMSYDKLPRRTGKNRNGYYRYDTYVEDEYKHGKELAKIYMEITAKGFKGSRTPFYDHYKYLCDGHHGYRSAKEIEKMKKRPTDNREPLVPINAISYMVDKSIRSKDMKEDEMALVTKLLNLKWFNEIYYAAASFYTVIRGDNVTPLKTWISTYEKSTITKLKTFVHGIKMDLNAVSNSIKYAVSNGIVEGYVNKLKEVKRTMYGRAHIELLKRKMVIAPIIFN